MNWQEIGVAIVVAGAVAFLVSRVIGRRRREKPAQTFVPLSSIRTRREPPAGDGPGCH